MLKKCLLPLLALSAPASAQTLNILLYHHVADDTPAVTSTRVADFIAQLDNFEQQGYEIVDLEQAVKQVQAGKPLEKRSIALTFDDGFKSVCDTAYPELKKRGLPFTVFVTTTPIDDNYQGYCSWDELKEMADNGVTIANHTLDHGHLVSKAI